MTGIAGALGSGGSAGEIARTAATGAALGAGASAGKSAWEGVSSAGFILLVLGIGAYFLRGTEAQPWIGVVLSFFAAYCIYTMTMQHEGEKTYLGFILVLIGFWSWYLIFGADKGSLLYIGVIVGVALIAYIMSKKTAGAQSAMSGVLAILVFFMESGVLFYYLDGLGLPMPGILEQLLIMIPWWALIGWLSLLFVKEGGAFLIGVKVVGGLALLVLVVSALPAINFTGGVLPNPEQLISAQREAQGRVVLSSWDILAINGACWGNIGEQTNVKACVESGKKERLYEKECEKEGYTPETSEFEKCLKERRQKNDETSLRVAGTVDLTIREPLTAVLDIDERSLNQDGTAQPQYVAEFRYLNPRYRPPIDEEKKENGEREELPVTFEARCRFEGKGVGNTVQGIVDPAGEVEVGRDYAIAITCMPQENLKGSYTLAYNISLHNLKTASRLERAFIGGDLDYKQKEKLREEIESKIVVVTAQAPADPARIDFDVGHVLGDPVIEYDPDGNRKITLRGNVKNTGKGRIERIVSYSYQRFDGFEIADEPMADGQKGCLSGKGIVFDSRRQREIALPSCRIEDYPADLKPVDGEEWIPKEFYAEMVYDYYMEQKITVVVSPPEVVS